MKKYIILVLLLACIPFAYGFGLITTSGGTGCFAQYGAELNNISGAADGDAGDADDSTGWTEDGSGTIATTNTGGEYYLGDWGIKFTVAANLDRVIYNLGGAGISNEDFIALSFHFYSGTTDYFQAAPGYSSSGYPIASAIRAYGNPATFTQYSMYYRIIQGHIGADTDYLVFQELGDNSDLWYIDNVSVKVVTPCLGAELYTEASAVNDSNESGVTGSWTAVGTPDLLAPTEGSKYAGTYGLAFEAANNGDGFYLDLASMCSNGVEYFIDIYANNPAGDAGQWGFSANGTSFATNGVLGTIDDTTYFRASYIFTYNSTNHYLLFLEIGSNDNCDLYIDSFSIKEVLDK